MSAEDTLYAAFLLSHSRTDAGCGRVVSTVPCPERPCSGEIPGRRHDADMADACAHTEKKADQADAALPRHIPSICQMPRPVSAASTEHAVIDSSQGQSFNEALIRYVVENLKPNSLRGGKNQTPQLQHVNECLKHCRESRNTANSHRAYTWANADVHLRRQSSGVTWKCCKIFERCSNYRIWKRTFGET